MDASHEPHDARRPAARSRSAPRFCRPQTAPIQPYRPRSSQSTATSDRTSSAPPPRAANLPKNGSVRTAWAAADSDAEADLDDRSPAAWIAIGRGVALMLATLLLVDLFADGGICNAGPWWLNTRPLPVRVATGLLGTVAGCLLLFAVRGVLPRGIRGIALLGVGLLMGLAVKDTTIYYGLLKRGDLHAGPPIAFSLHIVGCLGMVFLAIRAAPGVSGLRGTLLAMIGFGAAMLALPIAHVACQGPIDGRQSGAGVIIAGPRSFAVDADERMHKRIARAAELHQAGLVPSLILTNTENADQLAAMREHALAAGIPASEIQMIPNDDLGEVLADLGTRYEGINGREPLFLVVSDPDHLPRLLLSGRAAPVRLAGVPSETDHSPVRSVYVREIMALLRSYLRR